MRRHGICILNVDYLSTLKSSKRFFGNKFIMEKDYISLICINKWLKKNKFNFDEDYYRKLPIVKETIKFSH